ncbi:TIR domain-containing protein [Bifidobacterium pseudolongum]|uniref:toll/interleukin-1 receptor domain-containing protein n=1 Tax=Bifidobacterium pseudolongum TaxID=1694 RepID=UPI003F905336
MSVDQYQRSVNALDKDIADLEKKKAAADRKAADEESKANRVSWSKNASESTIKGKMRQIESHRKTALRAQGESADLQKKIADKRKKRNDAYTRLQKEQQAEEKKREKAVRNMRQAYEDRIAELEKRSTPIVRSVDHSGGQLDPEYDVFISHAWEDKKGFVDELADELRKAGFKVWYDTDRIKWGDSMRQKIDEGLSHSKFGIVVLSPNYIAPGKYWTKAELDALFSLESVNGKTLLPIWHNLTKQDVMNFSPIIANRKALTTAIMTAKDIAGELALLKQEETTTEE